MLGLEQLTSLSIACALTINPQQFRRRVQDVRSRMSPQPCLKSDHWLTIAFTDVHQLRYPGEVPSARVRGRRWREGGFDQGRTFLAQHACAFPVSHLDPDTLVFPSNFSLSQVHEAIELERRVSYVH